MRIRGLCASSLPPQHPPLSSGARGSANRQRGAHPWPEGPPFLTLSVSTKDRAQPPAERPFGAVDITSDCTSVLISEVGVAQCFLMSQI